LEAAFDDGIETGKNTVYVNATSLIWGNLEVGYERRFSEKYAATVYAGVILPWYLPELPDLLGENDFNYALNKGGFQYGIDLTYIRPFRNPSFERDIGISVRQRNYYFDTTAVNPTGSSPIYAQVNNYYAEVFSGARYNIDGRFSLKYTMGFGILYAIGSPPDPNRILEGQYRQSVMINMNFMLRFGYKF